jgi:hypothetical protein
MVEGAQGAFAHLRHQGITLAQETPQHGVDETGRRGGAVAHGCHGLVDQGVFSIGRRFAWPQQGQRQHQQGVDRRRRCLRGQQGPQFGGTAQPAQAVKAERLHARALRHRYARQHIAKGSAGTHRLHGLRGLVEQLPQRCGARACAATGRARG